MTQTKKPKLKPVDAPWMISPSTPFLNLHASETGTLLHATFAGYFKPDDQNKPQNFGGVPDIVSSVPVFEPRPPEEKSAYRMVRVTFEDAQHFRMLTAVSDSEVIREGNYDWSLVSGIRRPDEKISEFLRRDAETWLRTGFCPDARMYEVLESPWISELDFPNQLPWHHYLLLGADEYVEIVARAWHWEHGQPIW